VADTQLYPPVTRQPAVSLLGGCDAAQQLQAWLATATGQQVWEMHCPQLAPEAVYAALARTQATRYGLLLGEQGAILWSTFSQRHFTRLLPQYQEAVATGLCFWWQDQKLRRVKQRQFFALIRTLPHPALSRPSSALVRAQRLSWSRALSRNHPPSVLTDRYI